jgi:hypothetical protein
VCRYAYAVYLLRHRSFSYRAANAVDEGGKKRFQELITESPAFSFAMPDIARIRDEMKTLIEGLSRLYLPWKTFQVANDSEVYDDDPVQMSSPAHRTRSSTRTRKYK